MSACKRLMRRTRPYPMESLASYIIRLTESNYYSCSSWIFQMSGLKTRRTYANVFNRDNDDLSLLSLISDVEENILWSMTFPAVNQPYNGPIYYVHAFGSVILKKALQKNYVKFCPICLQSLPYYRLIWDLSFIKICPLHHCLLIDKCPQCHHQIKWYRPSIIKCRCKQTFCDCQPTFVTRQPISLSSHVYKLCQIAESELSETTPFSQSNPILLLNLNHLVNLLYFLVNFSKLPYIKEKFLLRLKSQVDLFNHGCYFDIAFSILTNWGHEFIGLMSGYEDYLARSYNSSVNPLEQKSQDVLSLFYSMLDCFPGDYCRFVRSVIEDYFWNFITLFSLDKIKISWRKPSFRLHSLSADIKQSNDFLSRVAVELKIKELTLYQLFTWSQTKIYSDTIYFEMLDQW